jgi:hypothetical protein
MVSGLVSDRELLVAHVEERVEQERKRIRRGTPVSEIADIMDWLAKVENKRRNFQIQQAEDLMSLNELRN